jgi:two-component system, cell cycle sensor histidine kinase and response regulator CckA
MYNCSIKMERESGDGWFLRAEQDVRMARLILAAALGLSFLAPAFGVQGAEGLTVLLNAAASPRFGVSLGFMTDIQDVSLALTSLFLLVALGWSVTLRRKVKEQTEQIRIQLQREAALELKYRDLFEQANDMVYRQDLTGKITALNQAGERILGLPRERALRMNLREFVVPSQLESFDAWFQRCLSGNVTPRFELEIKSSTNTQSVLEVSARPVHDGGKLTAIDGIARDVTEKKKAEEELRQSEERFSSAFRVSPVAIGICTEADWRFILVNDSFLRLFGFQPQEVVNYTALELGLWTCTEDRARVEKLFREQSSLCGVECKMRIKGGATRTTLLFSERINVGKVACALVVVHDITDRLQLEAQLRQALKMEAVGRLAAGVAHDFNNLLTIIQGNTELTLRNKNLEPKASAQLQHVSDAAQRAANLTRQLLTFSRQQNLQRKPLNLNEVICNGIRLFKHLLRSDISLKFQLAADLPLVNADPTMIEQVLMNLVVNARDAMSNGGDLIIKTTALEIAPAYRQLHPEACEGFFVNLSVNDSGCGMDSATQLRIFEPFFTTKEAGKGTGLGLATVYGVIKQHEGWIEVQSEVGQGSTFKVFLPSEKPSTAVPRRQRVVPKDHSEHTILVVENEPAVAELVGKVLGGEGHHMLEAADGLVALQVWNDHHGDIDLVVTDVRMAQGMSGVDLADNLQALQPDIKVLFTTAGSMDSLSPDVITRPNVLLLPKPFTPDELQQSVQNILNLRRGN